MDRTTIHGIYKFFVFRLYIHLLQIEKDLLISRGGFMTNKEYILDCLVDGDEAKTQIIEYFKFVNVSITESEIQLLLEEMINESLIVINNQWKTECGEYPFSLTTKGKMLWENNVRL